MTLTKLDETHYLDLTTLISVQFDESGSAKVQLSTGGSLILPPQAADSLRSHLTTGSVAQGPSDAEPSEGNLTLVSRKKGWFVLTENGLPYIVAAVNAKGSCSIRTFDGQTGAFRGKQYRSGDFQDSFPQLRSARELSIPQQPNLERDCRERLPEKLLRHLQEQLARQKTLPASAEDMEDRMFNPAFYGYPLSPTFDRSKLDSLLQQFENSVKRDIDKRLAVELRSQMLDPTSPGLKKETFERLARWCKTDGIYGDGMEIAQQVSALLFGRIVDRTSVGT